MQRNMKYMNGSHKSLPFLYQTVRFQNSIFNKCLLIHKIQQMHPLKMIPRFRNRRGCDRDMCGHFFLKKSMLVEISQQVVLGIYKTKFMLQQEEPGCTQMY
jgi:hypothetical protein